MEYDFYHWSAVLHSVSAFEIYRKVYRNVITPQRVADLLILRRDMPRSLHACMSEVVRSLALVASAESTDTQRQAGKLLATLKYTSIDEVLSTGLHAFLTEFLQLVNDLAERVSREFLVPSDS